MDRKPVLFLVLFISSLFLSVSHAAFASVSINEILYSSASKQWVEIYNDTDTDIDITQYKILDAGASVNGHAISAVSGGANILPAHSYGVVAKDATSVSATYLFHSALGISTSASDTVILKNGNSVIDTVSVPLNSATNGNSLQLVSGSWVGAIPTPGFANSNSLSSSGGGLGLNDSQASYSNSLTTTTSNTQTPTKTSGATKITTEIIGKTVVFAGSALILNAKSFGYNKEPLLYGKYFWNFGDGDSKEIQVSDMDSGVGFSHTYFYPGDYIVSLEYYANPYSETPDATNEMTITIVPNDIIISKIGDQTDFFVEISNNTDYDADISGWTLTNGTESFTFPKNTTIASKKKLTLSPKITNFSPNDTSSLQLMNQDKKTIFSYPDSSTSAEHDIPVVEAVVPAEVPVKSSEIIPIVTTSLPQVEEIPVVIPSTDLGASVVSSDVANNNSHSAVLTILTLILVGVGAGAVYFIRRKKVPLNIGDDFNILD
jgi:hypothetical protein